MGSLAPGWDSKHPGRPPPGFEEPGATATRDKRQSELTRQLSRQSSGPPSLGRVSAPSALQRAALSHTPSGAPNLARKSLSGAASPVGARSPPGSPSSPRQGECTVGSAPSRLSKLFHFDSLLHEGGGDAIDSKERWWARFDSSSLNAAPEETDMSVWRHGSFKLADPVHCLHYNEARREAGLEPVPCTQPGAAPPPQA